MDRLSVQLCTLVVSVMGMVASGCVSSENGAREQKEATPDRDKGPTLAPQSGAVRTVQLYRGDDETNLPVIERDAGQSLTLAFDLMAESGRPLTVSFHHADRTWTRDLTPNQVLSSYRDDRLVDYRSSQGTRTPYVHYTYQFPNEDIQFRLSGNYILRVREGGRRDSVLFERPFFVSEQVGRLQAGGEAFRVPGQQHVSFRPLAEYKPPPQLRSSSFGYTACFVRNGRLSSTRCQDRPKLARSPQLGFELQRDRAFTQTTPDFTVDLGDLTVGPDIERIDQTASPVRALLEPDYAQFGDDDFGRPLNGQIVVEAAVEGRINPSLTAEYVETTFAFVPPEEQPLAGGVVVTGSFAGMDPARGEAMQWQPGRGRYEETVLLKQGRYQYFYHSPDDRLRRVARRTQRLRNTYATFLYYQDTSAGTDRLLRVGTIER